MTTPAGAGPLGASSYALLRWIYAALAATEAIDTWLGYRHHDIPWWHPLLLVCFLALTAYAWFRAARPRPADE